MCVEDEEKNCSWRGEAFRWASGIATIPILAGADTGRTAYFYGHLPVLAGHAYDGSSLRAAFVRLRPDATLDTAFATVGKVTFDIASDDELVHGIAPTAYGPSSAGTFVGRAGTGTDNVNYLIGRVLVNGALDTTFNTVGYRSDSFDVYSHIFRGVNTIGANGRDSVASGYSWDLNVFKFLVAAFLSNGQLDTTFNTRGYNQSALSAYDSGALAMTITTGGASNIPTLVGAAFNGTDWDFGIGKYSTSGALDTSFSTDGTHMFNILSGEDKAYAVIYSMFTNGDRVKPIIGGFANNGSNHDFAIARLESDGVLDTTFHTDGKVSTGFSAGDDVIFAIQVDRDFPVQKILAAGSADIGGNVDVAVARYSSSGVLDTSFHTDGRNTFDVNGGFDAGTAITLSSDTAYFFVTGRASNGGNLDFFILKVNSDGSLAKTSDPSLSLGTRGDGSFRLDVSGNDSMASIDGAFDASGWFCYGNSGTDALVCKMTDKGALDTTFSTRGYQTFDFGGTDKVNYGARNDIVTSYLAGNNTSDFVVARITALNTATGILDTTFNTDGMITLDFSGNDSAHWVDHLQGFMVGRDGAGTTNMIIAKYNSSTTGLDTSFNTIGYRSYNPTGSSSVLKYTGYRSNTVQRIYAGQDTQDIVLMRARTDGAYDTTFNTVGWRAYDYGGTDVLGGAYVDTTGLNPLKFVFTGGNGSDIVTARVHTDGAYDTSFHTDGMLTLNFGTINEVGKGVALNADGYKIVIAGDDGINFLLARLHENGSLDTSFYTSGQRSYPMTGASTVNGLRLFPQGDICITGATNGNADAVFMCVNP